MRSKGYTGHTLGTSENVRIRERASLDREQHATRNHNGVFGYRAKRQLDTGIRAHEIIAGGIHLRSIQIRREVEAVAKQLQKRELETPEHRFESDRIGIGGKAREHSQGPFIFREQAALRILSFDEPDHEFIEVETGVERLTAQDGALDHINLREGAQFASPAKPAG